MVARPRSTRLPHPLPQSGVLRQIHDPRHQLGHIHLGQGRSGGAILRIAVDAALIAQRLGREVAGRKAAGGDAKAHIGRDGILHPVPVADQNRQSRRHRLDGRKAEGLLNVVDDKQESIRAR